MILKPAPKFTIYIELVVSYKSLGNFLFAVSLNVNTWVRFVSKFRSAVNSQPPMRPKNTVFLWSVQSIFVFCPIFTQDQVFLFYFFVQSYSLWWFWFVIARGFLLYVGNWGNLRAQLGVFVLMHFFTLYYTN